MYFKAKINNIGKLRDISISVHPLTILAGPNNTGKSFFSKTLYSVFDAMNTNLLLAKIQYHLKPLRYNLRIMQLIKNKKHNEKIKSIESIMTQLMKSCYSLSNQKEGQIF